MHMMGHVMKLHRHHIHVLLQDYEVYPGQPPLLMRLLERNGQSQSELAAKMRVKPATLTVMITRMQKNGLLERKPDPRDQRVSRVFLTEKGLEVAGKVKEAIHASEQKCFEDFREEEKLLLRRFLLHMHDNLSKDIESEHS
ncbi:MarR family winged helix-turn-helix transcriptional regulator [Paenibacillus hamazuiensis]|uniref:MarR family winged helix-turn-helix transcriptional regulator n=1 Tax=Paenibacillus hamazuiensis TaxID=2936508 RepID=UPI00200FE1D2|nr:MarR family transcriptional regulator [Paenibacillus hamazuiensis]